MIPGSNLLNQALTLIGGQRFIYRAFSSRSTNSIGLDVATYLPDAAVTGSIQAVPRNMYEQMGLDLQKSYINIYISHDVVDIDRDVSGDQVVFFGALYQCISKTAWKSIDGWNQVLAVRIGNA